MLTEMIEAMEEILKDDKFATLSAKVTKKTVDALIEEGFSRDEAIRLVVKK